MTQEQKDFIINNRLKMSVIRMVKETGVSRHYVLKFMKENKLQLNDEEKRKIKSLAQYEYLKRKTKKNSKWVYDFWNRGLNPVTMLRD